MFRPNRGRCPFGAAPLATAILMGLVFASLAHAQQPNIVYIVADDLGWKDVGYHGSDIATPNIDRLASTGTRLEHFYA